MQYKTLVKAIKNASSAYQQVAMEYNYFSKPFQVAVTYPKIISAVKKFGGDISGKKILDVGCGAGTLIEMFNECNAECSGVDITPAFVELAKSRCLDVTEASMHKLPFSDEKFDAVVSNYVLNYLPLKGQELALQEKFRVLKCGGVMVFSYFHPFFMRSSRYQEEVPHYSCVVEDYFKPQRQEVVSFFNQKFILYLLDWPEIVSMVARCGFRIQEIIDADVPSDLDKIATGAQDKQIAQFVLSFRYNPYAIFVVATK